jgi:prepilin-type N-terminal cleavage/methylation domain-containing protein
LPCRAAFTLVELLIVIAIMVVVMAIVVPSYRAMAAQNRRSSCAANLKAIGQALAIFREDYQCFPPDATENLWTAEAVAAYRQDYGVDPPGDHSVGTLVGAAYHPDGTPFATGSRGLGLFTLYYLGAYAAQLPPASSEPRLYDDEFDPSLLELRTSLQRRGQGLNGLNWFRGSNYIVKLSAFHCPANQTRLPEEDLGERTALPELGGWGNYDRYYRRNYWGNEFGPGAPTQWTRERYGDRNLFQPYPPADTVVTWCPYHRDSNPPSGPGVAGEIVPGDQDLVLFVDGSVRRMTAQRANRMYQEPSTGGAWPEGPMM